MKSMLESFVRPVACILVMVSLASFGFLASLAGGAVLLSAYVSRQVWRTRRRSNTWKWWALVLAWLLPIFGALLVLRRLSKARLARPSSSAELPQVIEAPALGHSRYFSLWWDVGFAAVACALALHMYGPVGAIAVPGGLALAASARVWFAEGYTTLQRLLQLALIWFIPVFGAILVVAMHASEGAPPRGGDAAFASDESGGGGVYSGVGLYS